ncbi:hypothetical protein [Carbonactinospora thermoautotrophica]|uniref:hypothetical protein n=1 Tax=Carbonactinospora thermoautotrophica TaxID=1469144 RepID=UPI000AD72826|nr:hypothetical protein [Carbonactinospora thermoautotrophica]
MFSHLLRWLSRRRWPARESWWSSARPAARSPTPKALARRDQLLAEVTLLTGCR